ncbi:uncharacterized protein LOC122795691 isoform X2 [Protopterus annectens]|uniref:uncharacterized protein LOC122795691 isoform X2 n=1 Tax=Protopterus annectens TaxID=7888 RepID=UPI001CFB0DF7|nr:uncharacterized protein LOC122795691 isoform X2 [Protopterus annectens]
MSFSSSWDLSMNLNLTTLDLHGCSRVQSAVLVDLIESLLNLRKLDLSKTQCNTQVLAAVGTTCKELRELNISECKQVTAESLRHLAYDQTQAKFICSELRVLLAMGVEPKGNYNKDFIAALAFLLMTLPNLEYLENGYVMEALCLIHGQQFGQYDSCEKDSKFPTLAKVAQSRRKVKCGDSHISLKLKRMNDVEVHFLEKFTSLCKEVVEVVISCSDEPFSGWDISSWSRLSHLTVQCTGVYGRPLSEMAIALESSGGTLQFLSLNNFLFDDETSLSAILNLCPNLIIFHSHLSQPQDAFHQPVARRHDNAEDDEDLSAAVLHSKFPHLKEFSLLMADPSVPLPSATGMFLKCTLISLLKNSPKLEKVSLLCIPVSLDKVFHMVLVPSSGALTKLREINLSHSQVSGSTVHLLMNADNHLNSIHLAHCQNIYRRDYDEFLRIAKRKKFDINITWE